MIFKKSFLRKNDSTHLFEFPILNQNTTENVLFLTWLDFFEDARVWLFEKITKCNYFVVEISVYARTCFLLLYYKIWFIQQFAVCFIQLFFSHIFLDLSGYNFYTFFLNFITRHRKSEKVFLFTTKLCFTSISMICKDDL